MVIDVLAKFIKFTLVAFLLAFGWFFYFIITYKVNPGLVSFGYDIIKKNEKSILKSAINSIEEKFVIDNLEKLSKTEGLKLDPFSIVPITSVIDRFHARENYYILYYSGADTRNCELFAEVYVNYDGTFSVTDAGKVWH